MKLNKEYNQMNETPPLKQFAFIGNSENFGKKLGYLAKLADDEECDYIHPNINNSSGKFKYGILFQYIHHTFAKAIESKKVLITEGYAIFNTGLITVSGEEIFMLFEKNRNSETDKSVPEWYFTSFLEESRHEIPKELRAKLPKHVDYFESSPQELYFDPTLPIYGNIKHIVEDNRDRLPDMIRELPLETIITIFEGAKSTLQKRVLRNNRLAVPQYYNKKIMYLLPLKLGGDTVIPLAVEFNENSYRINTILTSDMAYCNARLVMKPESNWLKVR